MSAILLSTRITPQATLREALAQLDRNGLGVLLVCDAQDRLLRTVTDGDLRRARLAGHTDDAPLAVLGSASPLTVGEETVAAQALKLMDQHLIDHLPVVDVQGRVVDLVLRRELSQRIWLSPPHLGEEETAFVENAFRTNWVAPLGPHVDGFERELAAHVGVAHAAALSSGTAAIHLGLILLGVQPGDTVFCSSFTFAASANPIVYCGARPVFIDSEPNTWNMSPAALERALEWAQREGRMPRCVIVVNLYGQSADMDALLPICQRHGVPVLEDAAESLGAQYRGCASGTFGVLGVYSFNGNKIITTSGGGMLVSADGAMVERARKLATQAREPARHYEHTEIGFNYRMSNVLAGIGRGQLRVLEQRVTQRREVFERYRRALSDVEGIAWMPEPEGHRGTRWLSCMTLDGADAPQRMNRVFAALDRHSIEARPLWKPMHLQPVYRDAPFFSHGGSRSDCDDVSGDLFRRGMCLPSGSSLLAADQDRVIDRLRQVLVGASSRDRGTI